MDDIYFATKERPSKSPTGLKCCETGARLPFICLAGACFGRDHGLVGACSGRDHGFAGIFRVLWSDVLTGVWRWTKGETALPLKMKWLRGLFCRRILGRHFWLEKWSWARKTHVTVRKIWHRGRCVTHEKSKVQTNSNEHFCTLYHYVPTGDYRTHLLRVWNTMQTRVFFRIFLEKFFSEFFWRIFFPFCFFHEKFFMEKKLSVFNVSVCISARGRWLLVKPN